MGKKEKNQMSALWELMTQQKGLKAKKKAIQYQCCHKTPKGEIALKPYGNDYNFKCKICRDKKVNLDILNPAKGDPKEQINAAFKIFKSAIDLAKIQSSNKDKKTIELFSSSLIKLDSIKKVLKKVLKTNDGGKKRKGKRSAFNVSSNGRSLIR